MTNEQLKRGKELTRKIDGLRESIECFNRVNQAGVCIVLPNDDKVIADVKKVILERLKVLNEEFKKL